MSDIRYFAHYDSGSGDIFGFFPTDLYPDSGSIPTPNIEITFDEWQTAISSLHIVVDGLLTPYQPTNEEQLNSIRKERDRLLQESDWVVLPYSPITGSKLEEWVTYRQDLRDVTNQSNPFEISWPTKPE